MAQTTKVRIIPAEQAAGPGIRAKIGIIALSSRQYRRGNGRVPLLPDARDPHGRDREARPRPGLAGHQRHEPDPDHPKGVLKTIAEETRKEEAVDYVVILKRRREIPLQHFRGEKIPDEVANAAKGASKTAADRRNLKLRGIEILGVSAGRGRESRLGPHRNVHRRNRGPRTQQSSS